MVCMRLGSKADVFHSEGQSWLCTTGLPSDVCIIVEDISFHLHKFPLSSRSQLLEKLIQGISSSQTSEHAEGCILSLPNLPGGAKSFLLVAKFCYGVKFEVTSSDVVSLRCASEFLKMSEDYGEGNLITQTVNFLDQVLESWIDTIKALETCESVLPFSEQLHIISRCIDSLAIKACSDLGPAMEDDWWYNDLATLKLPFFKRVILAVGLKGIMVPERIAGAIMYYAKSYLPLNGRDRKNPKSAVPVSSSDADRKALIEEIIRLLPNQKGATPTGFLAPASEDVDDFACEPFEPGNIGETDRGPIGSGRFARSSNTEPRPTLRRHFTTWTVCRGLLITSVVSMDRIDDDKDSEFEEDRSRSVAPMTVVANLLDSYLAEVAPDVNLKLENFLLLAASIPDYARPLDDGIYRAIDVYLKTHPGLTDSERELLCRLINCQKLSLEASLHASQNERLPLRVVVQVLFFEQLRLRTSVAGCFFVSDNLDNSEDLNECTVPLSSEGGHAVTFNGMRERVSELEKECKDMRSDIEKLVKTKGSWSSFVKRFGLKFGTKSFDLKSVLLACNGYALQPSRKAVLNRK